MIVQSGHHNHSIECTLFLPWYSWWLYKVDITIIVSNVPCFYPDIQSSAISGKEQGTFDTMLVMSTLSIQRRLCSFVNRGHTYLDLVVLHNHSIECTLFFPWYSWWLYKVYITIIVSNVPCSFPDTADDCTKWTSQFDTMIVMSTLYNHQLYQGKNKVHSILWLWCPLCTIISCIRERTRYIRYYDCDVHFVIVSNVPCSFPDTADDCTKWKS
jgi:hypothetical protein